jgi:catecholate siderophore receptor
MHEDWTPIAMASGSDVTASIPRLRSAGDATTLRFDTSGFRTTEIRSIADPSFGNRPVETDATTFFGDPGTSNSLVTVNAVNAAVDRRPRGASWRNRTGS